MNTKAIIRIKGSNKEKQTHLIQNKSQKSKRAIARRELTKEQTQVSAIARRLCVDYQDTEKQR